MTSICTVSSPLSLGGTPPRPKTHTYLLFSNHVSNYSELCLLRLAAVFLRVLRLGMLVVKRVCCSWAVATADINQRSWSRKSKISCRTLWISANSYIIHFLQYSNRHVSQKTFSAEIIHKRGKSEEKTLWEAELWRRFIGWFNLSKQHHGADV